MTNLEQGDVVRCTVEKVAGTVVFVKIHLNGNDIDGSIITSEIAPGRIRNIRDYVVPKKSIVCKVLRISSDGKRIDLSLRRVTAKERKEVLDEYKSEKNSEGILRGILKDNAREIIAKIKEEYSLFDFLENSKTNPKSLENLVGKENAKKILEIINKQKIKEISLKKEIELKSEHHNGIDRIKEILTIKNPNLKIKYLAPGKYTLNLKSEDYKKANIEMQNVLDEIEKKSKKQEMEFSVKDKK